MAHRFDFAVIGAGSWGTALASHLARSGQRTVLIARDPEQAFHLQHARVNTRYLPDQPLPPTLEISSDFAARVAEATHLVIATPSHGFSEVVKALFHTLPHLDHLIWATKGLDPVTGAFLHESVIPYRDPYFPMLLLTGPSFAKELMAHKPTAITLAHNGCAPLAHQIQKAFHGGNVRAYTCEDLVGAELGGAVKNILAIAVGIADELNVGMNAKAALMTRGMAEMMRLGKAVGAHPETLMGLSGLGDLILTCSDNQSRNRRLGVALGSGQSLEQARNAIGQVVEGISTTATVYAMAEKHGISMPITGQMVHVLFQGLSPLRAVENLFGREAGAEH